MQDKLSLLPEYAFPRLRNLLKDVKSKKEPIEMHIGEPKHLIPKQFINFSNENINEFGFYPPNEGVLELRVAITNWLIKRYGILNIDPDKNVMTLNGSREGLFNSALALCPKKKNNKKPVILMPNPFYQCYLVASLIAGSKPIMLNTSKENNYLPELEKINKKVLSQTSIFYVCSPTNPQGGIAKKDWWKKILTLAEENDFIVFSDECYSEIYHETIPTGALEVANQIGVDFNRIVIFNSLSKRSNLPGLRSGFVASGEKNIIKLKKLKSYSGAPNPIPLQRIAAKVWNDEEHVNMNRKIYKSKILKVNEIFSKLENFSPPEAGFFIWLKVKNDEKTTKKLWKYHGVKVLPGSYLSGDRPYLEKKNKQLNNFIRIALVSKEEQVISGAKKIVDYIQNEEFRG